MHEVGLMREVIDAATAAAAAAGATRVHAVRLRVGRLAGVEPDALAFAFDVAAAGTPVEGAALSIDDVTVLCHCPRCDAEFAPPGFAFACPRCGDVSRDVRRGTELELASLEVS